MVTERNYWRDDAGVDYARQWRRTPAFALQERAVLRAIRRAVGRPRRVLDLACGFGRYGVLLGEGVEYTGVDVSPQQLAEARRRLPHAQLVEADVATYRATTDFDVVLCIEYLMHVPPDDVERAARHVLGVAQGAGAVLVTCDWAVPVPGPIDPHNWLHDYGRLLLPDVSQLVGLQQISVVWP